MNTASIAALVVVAIVVLVVVPVALALHSMKRTDELQICSTSNTQIDPDKQSTRGRA